MKEIKCLNCGAMFSSAEPQCPYCGHINPTGAEAKFMRRLGKTKSNLNTISEDVKQTHLNAKSKGIRFVVKIVIPIIVVFLVIFGIANRVEQLLSSGYDKGNYTNELVWQHNRFEEYNKMFENKEYEALLEAIASDSENHEVYNWDHYEEFSSIADDLWGNKD